MPEIIQSRRSFIRGLGALFVAAPAIVRASSLMQIRGEKLTLDGVPIEFDEDRYGPSFIFETNPDGVANWVKDKFFGPANFRIVHVVDDVSDKHLGRFLHA